MEENRVGNPFPTSVRFYNPDETGLPLIIVITMPDGPEARYVKCQPYAPSMQSPKPQLNTLPGNFNIKGYPPDEK